MCYYYGSYDNPFRIKRFSLNFKKVRTLCSHIEASLAFESSTVHEKSSHDS